ncbi:hypothetical protein Ndes2526B_g05104 [Nannochloris sp. 'desiccata']
MADLGEFPSRGESTHVLRLLDAAARCTICYSIFDAPLSLRGCGHSFCAACIRQNLGFQEKMGDPRCPSCRAPCDARDLQPNVSLRELADKYNAARSEVIRLVVQEREHDKIGTRSAAVEAEAALVGKKARKEDPVVGKNSMNAPRRSSRRSAAKEVEAAQQTETGFAAARDDTQPGPSTRSTRNRAKPKGKSPRQTNKLKKEEVDIDNDNCIAILSDDEAEEEKIKEEERSVDHDEDFDFTMEGEEEGNEEDEDDEEFSPSPPLKKQRNLQQKQPSAGAAAGRGITPAGAASTAQGFVPCPICAKSVPSFYINSHVDACLNSGGGLASGSGGFGSEELDPGVATDKHNATLPLVPPPAPAQLAAARITENKSNLRASKPPSPRQCPHIPLAVPPCLVPALASDKIIRAALKKYNLPSDGKKSEMFDRYSQFRTAVLTANDRQERTSYNKIAQKMAAQERQRAAAALLGGGGAKSAVGGGLRQGNGTHKQSSALNNNSKNKNNEKRVCGDPTVLQGDSFEELIAVTKARDAARRAARAATAASEEEEREAVAAAVRKDEEQAVGVLVTAAEAVEEKEDRFYTLQEQGSPEVSLSVPAYTSSPIYHPFSPKEEEEEKEPSVAAAVPNTREEMIAAEVCQAHKVGLLDSDDDNW